MFKKIIAFLLFSGLLFLKIAEAKKARTLYLSEQSIANIYLTQGHSTALKFDKVPRPAIIGNKKAFLVETFQKVVAIKALTRKSKTNLFIFTSEGNFNFNLVSGSKNPDTFVLVKRKQPVEEKIFSRDKLKVYRKPLTLVVHKVLFPKSKNISSIYFSIFLNTKSKKGFKVEHLKFYVFQSRNKIPIQKIFVDKPLLSFKNKNISGYLILNSKHLLKNQSLVLKLSAKTIRKPLYLKIPFL